ncbi:hypothetical protein PF003_g37949 [Phytophthora fragariae]|nr:hypothetical protein PF003_g37949 [Phytophthora fragariae]
MHRHVVYLMQVLLLNYPQLLVPGDRHGETRYSTKEEGHISITRGITSQRQIIDLTERQHAGAELRTVTSHKELLGYMQAEVGTGTVITYVHPHPRLARMACLWVGNRKAYKELLGAAKKDKGMALSTARQRKWTALSTAAATALEVLTWKRIRRIVGLNPWGEQLLIRVKLHAISVHNPVTAGLGCPHPGCERVGRVDLYHVFWECTAARQLREILIWRWKAAGLRLEPYEEAVFDENTGQTGASHRENSGSRTGYTNGEHW